MKEQCKYGVSIEIAGELAHFCNPASGSGYVTYPFPTFSAAKGIFESILRLRNAAIVPYKLEICNPIKLEEITYNYHGHLRKVDLLSKRAPGQVTMIVLADVCYKIYANPINIQDGNTGDEVFARYFNVNSAHAYQDQFNRRLKGGQRFYTPVLGLSDFLPTYCGQLRDGTSVLSDINMVVPHMLNKTFGSLSNGHYDPTFCENVKVENGVVYYSENDGKSVDGITKTLEAMEV